MLPRAAVVAVGVLALARRTAAQSTVCDAFRVIYGGTGDQTANPLNTDAGIETRHELTCCADEQVAGWASCTANNTVRPPHPHPMTLFSFF